MEIFKHCVSYMPNVKEVIFLVKLLLLMFRCSSLPLFVLHEGYTDYP